MEYAVPRIALIPSVHTNDHVPKNQATARPSTPRPSTRAQPRRTENSPEARGRVGLLILSISMSNS